MKSGVTVSFVIDHSVPQTVVSQRSTSRGADTTPGIEK
jgi:hypothetical protein